MRGRHTAQSSVITLTARSQLHFPALLCMYSLSGTSAGRAARLHQISYSVCEVTAEFTVILNHWEHINSIVLVPSAVSMISLSLRVYQDEKVKLRVAIIATYQLRSTESLMI